MNIFMLPNKNLMVPSALSEDDIIGDGLEEIDIHNPKWEQWMDWAENNSIEIQPYVGDVNPVDVDDGLRGR